MMMLNTGIYAVPDRDVGVVHAIRDLISLAAGSRAAFVVETASPYADYDLFVPANGTVPFVVGTLLSDKLPPRDRWRRSVCLDRTRATNLLAAVIECDERAPWEGGP